MQRTIAAFGLGCALLAGCADTTTTADSRPARDEGYIPTGSNIPRKNPKRSDMPSVTSGQLDTLVRGGSTVRTP
jgi:hypothetical protein